MPKNKYGPAFEEVMEDLLSRFLINVPPEEREDTIRLGFAVEQMWWHYSDLNRKKDASLPKLSFELFLLAVLKHWSLLHGLIPAYKNIANEFKQYKQTIPSCGAIMLDTSLKNVVVVSPYHAKAQIYSFPMGKINRDETWLQCAAREVFEETSFDITPLANEQSVVEIQLQEKRMCFFVVPNVPKDFPFECRTRNEIGTIEWRSIGVLEKVFKAKDKAYYIPNKCLPQLRRKIAELRKQRKQGTQGDASAAPPAQEPEPEPVREEERTFTRPTAWTHFRFDTDSILAAMSEKFVSEETA